MPRKPSPKSSVPSSEDDKVGRPAIEEIAAAEENRADAAGGKDPTPDVPKPGDTKAPDQRKRCQHGRLFQCRQCDSTKGQLTPEEREKRREKLENTVGQVYNAVFNLAAVITGEESLRLTREERHAFETTGASTVEEVAPAVSLPILAAVGHVATVAGTVAGKLIDLPKEQEKRKDAALRKKLNGNGQPDEKHPAGDRGGEAAGKDDSSPPLFRIQGPPADSRP